MDDIKKAEIKEIVTKYAILDEIMNNYTGGGYNEYYIPKIFIDMINHLGGHEKIDNDFNAFMSNAKNADDNTLDQLIKVVGPGYARFCLVEILSNRKNK